MLALLLGALTFQAVAPAPSTTLHNLFTNDMVLQRDKPLPIYGTAAPGQKVTVVLADQMRTTVAGAQGTWLVNLKPMHAGGPYTLVVTGDRKLVVQNVEVGEVWICSGQSNMEWRLSQAKNGDAEVAAADYPQIRLFHVYHRTVDQPLHDIEGRWESCRPEIARAFSAIGYFFGRNLYKRLNVPIGLIESDWGGTPAESWTSKPALLADPALKPMVVSYQKSFPGMAAEIGSYRRAMDAYNSAHRRKDPGNKGFTDGWAEPTFDDSTWLDVAVPGSYSDTAKVTSEGAVWYRKSFELTAEQAKGAGTLELGAVDDNDVTYVNGIQIGETGADVPDAASVQRKYSIPANVLKEGTNVVAVRDWNSASSGGLLGPNSPEVLIDGAPVLRLTSPWKFAIELALSPEARVEAPVMPLIPGNPWVPSSLYNGMIYGLAPFAFRGVIWYQGESNADRPAQYRTLFPTMINSWRATFGQGDFPFYFVQLANFKARSDQPRESDWAELREAQATALKLPNTGMAVTIDVGEADTIHPKDKQTVGFRLSSLALNRVYQMGGEDSGPSFRSMQTEGSSLRLSFDHIGGGLMAKDGPLAGFAIAGDDHKFYWATAKVERGTTVLLQCDKVPHPVAVRYAWGDNPACNLINGSGLPAAPFRTDFWSRRED